MKKKRYHPPLGKQSGICMLLALAAALGSVFIVFNTETRTRLPYADVQLTAAKQMAAAQQAVLEYVHQQGIAIEPDDLNQTGLIGPEWTELTSSLGMLEAKRTALQPDFAALMVKYYQQAGLKSGDTVCCGMSGSFPGLGIATVCAANQMGLKIRIIASYGSSMYGATRLELSNVRILEIARDAGILEYEMLAVSPGNDFDQGNSLMFPNARQVIFALAEADGLEMIDEETLAGSIQKRLELYGPEVDCFVNVGGASANMGASPYTLTFPNGLVTDPPKIPQDEERGLTFEYAARNVPVIHLLNVRGLAEDNGLPFDPVPLTQPGETSVYYVTWQSPWYAAMGFATALVFLFIGWKSGRKKGSRQ